MQGISKKWSEIVDRQLFMVEYGNAHIITYAHDREQARRNALDWLGANPDDYIVTPLTEKGDRIKLDIILYV